MKGGSKEIKHVPESKCVEKTWKEGERERAQYASYQQDPSRTSGYSDRLHIALKEIIKWQYNQSMSFYYITPSVPNY